MCISTSHSVKNNWLSLCPQCHAPPVNPENVMKLVQWLDDKQLALLTPSLLGPHPNCYTFSKRLAENLVELAHPDLPVVIARPSIGNVSLSISTMSHQCLFNCTPIYSFLKQYQHSTATIRR